MNANILTQRSKLMVIGMKNRKNYSYESKFWLVLVWVKIGRSLVKLECESLPLSNNVYQIKSNI